MTIERVDRSYFWPFVKDKTRELKPGDKGPSAIFGEVEIISDDTIRVKGNKWLGLSGKTYKREEINSPIAHGVQGDSLHWFPPRSISYRYKQSNTK